MLTGKCGSQPGLVHRKALPVEFCLCVLVWTYSRELCRRLLDLLALLNLPALDFNQGVHALGAGRGFPGGLLSRVMNLNSCLLCLRPAAAHYKVAG